MRVQIHGSPFKFTKIFSCFIKAVQNVNSNLFLKILTQKSSFRVLNLIVRNVNSDLGASAPQFEPFTKNKTINLEKGEIETETDETGTGSRNIHIITSETENEKEKTNSNTITTANEELKSESREELNTNLESKSKTKNEKTAKTKTKNKATPQTTQKFSNHIKFIDYIPTHELITYRHLFAYGFYVE